MSSEKQSMSPSQVLRVPSARPSGDSAGTQFSGGRIALLASPRSEGKRVQFNGKSVQIQRLDTFDFSNTQIGLFSAGGSVSAEFAPKAAAQGCIVVDNTSHFRNDDDIPLVVSEVNPECVRIMHLETLSLILIAQPFR